MSIELRPEVQAFAEAMEAVLREHDDEKNGWEDCSPESLFLHLKDEVSDLEEELDWCKPEEAMHEAVDVANMAMMVWDNIRRPQ